MGHDGAWPSDFKVYGRARRRLHKSFRKLRKLFGSPLPSEPVL
jgi:hypothetical protein